MNIFHTSVNFTPVIKVLISSFNISQHFHPDFSEVSVKSLRNLIKSNKFLQAFQFPTICQNQCSSLMARSEKHNQDKLHPNYTMIKEKANFRIIIHIFIMKHFISNKISWKIRILTNDNDEKLILMCNKQHYYEFSGNISHESA